MVDRNEFIINHHPEDKYPWYVQQVALLDYGRFTTQEAAIEHQKFLSEKYKDTNT